MTARGDLVTRDATASKRLPIGAAGSLLSSDGTDVLWKAGAAVATEDAAGLVEIATEAENAARASALLAVTPKYNPLPPGFLFGCTLSNGAAPATDIAIAAGKARDSTDAVNIILAATITKQLSAVWALGSGVGGLDTGTAANVTYHVWLIKRSDTGVVDALFSVSATAPTMPANYDFKRRIGSILREAASIVAFRQSGDRFWRSVPTGDVNDTDPGTAAVTRLLKVPIGIQVEAMLVHSIREPSQNRTYYGLLSSMLDPSSVPSAAIHDVLIFSGGEAASAASTSVSCVVTTNTLAQIRSRLSLSLPSTVEMITTLGWTDTRDRL
jgi:hypothetical protein